tara:strand:- start:53 stop:304 length:252 start_codon:yes stop_codon:yes gene_type:complete
MKYKLLAGIMLPVFVLATTVSKPTTAIVTIVGACIKASTVPLVNKYPRKDCPICKGKGWYISGDGIAKVDCGYCEETTEIEYK